MNRNLGFFLVLSLVSLAVVTLPVTVVVLSPGLSSNPTQSPIRGFTVGPNISIVGEAAPDRQQVEPTIAVDPRNSSIIVAGAQDLRLTAVGEHRWHGYYRSTDSGLTWSSSLLPGFPGDTSSQGLSSPLHGSNATSDPVMVFDNHGNLYYAGLIFNVTASGIPKSTVFVAKYSNDGATYSGTTMITGIVFADKEWIAVDNTGGPSDGNLYMAFDANLTATTYFGTLFTRSIDGGKTFSPPFYAPSDETGELPGLTVDPAGNVYVSTDAFNPVTGNPLNYTQVSKITQGGTVLDKNVRVVDPAHWVGSIPGGRFRVFTIPELAADEHGVYMVWDDNASRASDVLFTRSTDGGSSWSPPLRVNDATQGQHFFPTIAASGGIIHVAWYDSRLNTGTTITSLDVFYSQSTDGGTSFSPSLKITDSSFNPELVERADAPNYAEPFIGDYIGIAATPAAAHLIWTSNANACDTTVPIFGCVDQDVYTATIANA